MLPTYLKKSVLCMSTLLVSTHAFATVFNSDFLSVDDAKNLDLTQFAHADYTMPGDYLLDIQVNDQYFGRQSIRFIEGTEPGTSHACLPEQLVKGFGLKPAVFKTLPRTDEGLCVDLEKIDGVTIRYEKSSARLKINIPQAAFEYDDPNYIPRERWSDGIDGAMLDYHVIGNTTRQYNTGYGPQQNNWLQAYGTVGANAGAWRFRGDYQANTGGGGFGGSNNNLQFNRLYAYRALTGIRSTVSLGNNYLNSDIFDTFAYTGASIQSDDRMLPPAMRGYAPLITGVAHTNATVTVSQQGRVLYSRRVSAGAFALQDVTANVQGSLDVTVQEEDGSVQKFTVTSASVPFLAREGQLRYKFSVGQPRLFGSPGITPWFGAAEAAYGLPKDVTIYGGTIDATNYTAAALGIGKDLGSIGAVSVDVTTSNARLWWNGQRMSGQSYRFNYSKHFDSLDTDLRFFGYRFSDRTYTTFPQFIGDATSYGQNGSRQRLSMTLAKRLFGVSTFLSYDHSSYWDRESDDRYGISLARTVSFAKVKNVNLNFSAFRTQGISGSGNQIFLSASIPLGGRQTVSTSVSSSSAGGIGVSTGVSGSDADGFSYSVFGGAQDGRPMFNANARKMTSAYQVSMQASTVINTYTAASLELDGSFVATKHGVAAHSNGNSGDTRLLVSTDGVSDVPLTGTQAKTNRAGYAVIGAVSPFDTFNAQVNTNKLALDTQVTNPVQRLVLTDGAIGYVHFDAARGRNALVELNDADGKAMPFGASVMDRKTGREIGIVGEHGVTYLSQIQTGSDLVVEVSEGKQCRLGALPDSLPSDGSATPVTCSP
ncbi:fimbrial protein [Burkholderia sp. SRS-W-2-2016]|uniref:fimbria/pilus outer membrane usher protein n=1 Tax=Burkholderia sp. SRS-W-2-2016 TaxID=1926878 RepID=UPI00094B0083|nr:fimbria/pilus outer membrane usher protein [Burkholderia sp. SRS-W-2-2016]OLL28250.1 fimbrial protein [Burkholderia sp. SRS-W-2-2016]